MKKLLIIPAALMLFAACKKPTSDLETTPTLDVEEKNMGVLGVRTATWCGPCGQSLNGTQSLFEQNKHLVVGMAFKDAFSEAQSVWGDYLFEKVGPQFDLGNGVPTSFQNFNTNTVAEHLAAPVFVNGNYEIEFNGNEMTINTTTKFFKDYSDELYIVPFVIVDDIIGQQNSHPDSPNTVHKRYVADVAYLMNKTIESKFEWGYRVSSGVVKAGHTVNLKFKSEKKSHWVNNKISIGLIYFRKVGNEFFFVNAFTKS
jgi:hypothetical protein